MIHERTSGGLAVARAEGRIGSSRKKLDMARRREIAESVIHGAQVRCRHGQLYNIIQPTVSRTIAQ